MTLDKTELLVLETIYGRRAVTCNTSQVYREMPLSLRPSRATVQAIINDLRFRHRYVEDTSRNAAYRWRLTPAGVEAMKAAQGVAPAPTPAPVPPGVSAAKENAGLLVHIRADHDLQPPMGISWRELPEWHARQPCSGWE